MTAAQDRTDATSAEGSSSGPLDQTGARRAWLELGLLVAILGLAALLRLPGLDQRGQWDSDQGHDMTVLAGMLHGQIPLLGPVTSVGTFHHGALYYYLLAPSALISSADPVAVTLEIALLGIAAVGATWWLARLVGGPLAGAVAALLLAVSPAGISESTFIWNPNPIPLFAALALGGAIQGRRTARARWWLLAAVGTMATMQLHWLGGVIAIPVVAMWASELVRQARAGRDSSTHLRIGAAAAIIVAAGYVPLAIHEASSNFSEVRAVLAYIAGSGGAGVGGGAQAGVLERVVMVVLRALTWPVAGLVTDRPTVSLVAMSLVVLLGAAAWLLPWRGQPTGDAKADSSAGASTHAGADRGAGADASTGAGGERGAYASPDAGAERGAGADTDAEARGPERWPVTWLIATLGVSAVALAVLAPSLAVVTPGLPNDHYHAFLDPVVLALVGTGAARLVRATLRRDREQTVGRAATPRAMDRRATDPRATGPVPADPGPPLRRFLGPATAVALVGVLAVVALTASPPPVSPDGGWRLADAAAAQVIEVVDSGWPPDEPRLLVGLPFFKPDDALRFPLTRRGMTLQPVAATPSTQDVAPPVGVVVVVCDPLFDDATGLACGSLAEDSWLSTAYPPASMQLVERFRAGSRRILSIYAPSRLAARAAP